MEKKKLTTKQQRFVDFYDGNATETAKKAGYKGNRKTLEAMGRENLAKPRLAKAIREREQKRVGSVIANREERQIYWTKMLRGEIDGATIGESLRASELLGRSEGDFLNRHEHSGSLEIEEYKRDIVLKAQQYLDSL